MSRDATLRVLGALLATLLVGGGCIPLDFDDSRPVPAPTPTTTPPPPQQPVARPPTFEAVTVADWPPVGPKTGVEITVRDPDANLSAVHFDFKHHLTRPASGGLANLSITGPELGEGFGSLLITATDTTQTWAQKTVTQLLVDLTPPKITLGQTVVAADGELELWVGDAWILGEVRLAFGNQVLIHTFSPGFPETLGVTWDYSLVKFPMAKLPAGEDDAVITAIDAAGNSVSETVTLVIDGEPPVVAITSPAEGASVSGVLTVELSASDSGGGPVWLELALGGTPVATATGPSASLAVDTGELVSGPTTLTATAIDRAGNQSTTTRSIVIQ